jgi:hypothetical protein
MFKSLVLETDAHFHPDTAALQLSPALPKFSVFYYRLLTGISFQSHRIRRVSSAALLHFERDSHLP